MVDGTLRGPMREQIAEHLKRCPDCAAVQSRLRDFDDETLPEPEAEWKQARPRLDNWFENFLCHDSPWRRQSKD